MRKNRRPFADIKSQPAHESECEKKVASPQDMTNASSSVTSKVEQNISALESKDTSSSLQVQSAGCCFERASPVSETERAGLPEDSEESSSEIASRQRASSGSDSAKGPSVMSSERLSPSNYSYGSEHSAERTHTASSSSDTEMIKGDENSDNSKERVSPLSRKAVEKFIDEESDKDENAKNIELDIAENIKQEESDVVILPSGLRSAFQFEMKKVLERRRQELDQLLEDEIIVDKPTR